VDRQASVHNIASVIVTPKNFDQQQLLAQFFGPPGTPWHSPRTRMFAP